MADAPAANAGSRHAATVTFDPTTGLPHHGEPDDRHHRSDGATPSTIDLAKLDPVRPDRNAAHRASRRTAAAAGTLQDVHDRHRRRHHRRVRNGQKLALGQIALADVQQPRRASRRPATRRPSRRPTPASPRSAPPAPAAAARCVGGALEMSNVDLAPEFTNLIIAQRGFQANSKVITTSDEMLQDLVNLKR